MAQDFGIKVSNTGTNINSTNLQDYSYHSSYKIMATRAVFTLNYTFSSQLIGSGGTASAAIEVIHNDGLRYISWASINGPGTLSIPAQVVNKFLEFYNLPSPQNVGGRGWWTRSDTDRFRMEYYKSDGQPGTYTYNETGQAWSFKFYAFTDVV